MAESSNLNASNQLNHGKRKKNKKYYGGGKKGKYESIQTGMRGVLVFGADNEAKARREAYSLLNEYADELFGTEFKEHVVCPDGDKKLYQQHDEDEDSETSEDEQDDVDDIEKVIAKEIKQIKNLKKSRRFQDIPTGVNAILFIKTTLSKEELHKLIQSILSDIAKTKQNKVRSFQRLVPITDICSADLKTISKTVNDYLLPDEDAKKCTKKICVHFKSRFNNKLTRQEVLHEVSSIFLNAGYKVDLKSPDMTIVVEVMKGFCFMSILGDFFHFKKYNLHSIANDAKSNTKDTVEKHSAEIGSSVYDDYYPCVGIQV